MEPTTLALLAIPSIAQAGFGAIQYAKGNRLAKSAVRPQYQTPQGFNEALLSQRGAAVREMPGQNLMEQNIQASTSGGIRSVREGGASPAAMLAAISSLSQNQNQAMNQLGVQGANWKEAQRQKLNSMLMQLGQYQDKEFEINKMQPYRAQVQAAEAMKGAGLQNIFKGIDQASAIGAGYLSKGAAGVSNTQRQNLSNTSSWNPSTARTANIFLGNYSAAGTQSGLTPEQEAAMYLMPNF